MSAARLIVPLIVLVWCACGGENLRSDAAPDDAPIVSDAMVDAAPEDAWPDAAPPDAAVDDATLDAPPEDAWPDAAPPDAAVDDATLDAPPEDAWPDAAPPDAAVTDARPDAGIDAMTTEWTLTIHAAGTGSGDVLVDGMPCGLPCTRTVTDGTTLQLVAATTSKFAGWTGGGCGADLACTVTIHADLDLTVTFTADTGELWTVMTSGVYERVAVTSDGALVVAGVDPQAELATIARYSAGGSLAWAVTFTADIRGAVFGVVPDAAGGVYVVDAAVSGGCDADTAYIRHLSATGTTLWQDYVNMYDGNPLVMECPFPGKTTVARMPDGGFMIALPVHAIGGPYLSTLFQRYDSAGIVEWSQLHDDFVGALAVSSNGAVDDLPMRWTADGGPLSNLQLPPPILSGTMGGDIAIDTADRLLNSEVTSSQALVRALTPDASPLWASPTITAPLTPVNAYLLRSAPTGGSVIVIGTMKSSSSAYLIDSVTSSGALGTQRELDGTSSSSGAYSLPIVADVATMADGRVVVVGTVQGGGAPQAFIRLYSP